VQRLRKEIKNNPAKDPIRKKTSTKTRIKMSQFVEALYGQLHARTQTHTHKIEMLEPFLRTEILTLERSHDEQDLPKKERIVTRTSLHSFTIGGTGLLILIAQ
jgi:hypothetical protein